MSPDAETRRATRIGYWTLGILCLSTLYLSSELYAKYGWLEAALLVYAQIQVLMVAIAVGQLHAKVEAIKEGLPIMVRHLTGLTTEIKKLPAALSEFVTALVSSNVSRH